MCIVATVTLVHLSYIRDPPYVRIHVHRNINPAGIMKKWQASKPMSTSKVT